MDGRIFERLRQCLGRLRHSVFLINEKKIDCLTGEKVSVEIPSEMTHGVIVRSGKWFFMPSEILKDTVWMLDAGNNEFAQDLLLMADMIAAETIAENPGISGKEEAYRQILLDSLDEWELDETLNNYSIERNMPRCVLVMETDVHWHGNILDTLKQVLPSGPEDVLVPMDGHSVAYLADMSAVEEREDLLEFANAAQESVMSEAGCDLVIGVGGYTNDIIGLHVSYEQARHAVRLGRLYEPQNVVYDYQQMLLPRFLSDLPIQLASTYHYMLFNSDTARLFNDELLETARTFFDKDLNLSDTARQLYIHRNTLTYRLDKIQKITGLDLRKFDDAVTFKILLDMKKCIPDT